MLPKNSSKGFASVVRFTDAPQDQMTSAIAAICKSSFGPRNQVCSQDVIVFSSQVYDTSLTDKDIIMELVLLSSPTVNFHTTYKSLVLAHLCGVVDMVNL